MAVATTQEGMIFVAGEFRAPSAGATTDVVEKATGHVLSTVGVATVEDVDAMQVASKLRSGMVHVNDSTCLDEAHVPFGGLGASGLGGRAGGDSNIEEFTERRWVSLQRARSEYPY